MSKNLIKLLERNRFHLSFGLVWILVWGIPWGKLSSIQGNLILAFLTDMVRLGVALSLFIFPGALLYILFRGDDQRDSVWPGIISIGFTFSVFIVALIGLIGRIVGLSFVVVKYGFVVVGLVQLWLVAVYKPDFRISKHELSGSLRNTLRNPPLILALVLATLMTFHDYLFFIDDTTYLAYLTSWQHALQLGFKNIVHGTDSIEIVRFWLAMNPMWQALLSDLSGLPGLVLLGNYLELFLVPLAVITAYWFARILGLSQKAAGFAVLIQITLYAWMLGDHFPVGMWFYQSLSEDKVIAAFIFAPVFFTFGLSYIQNPERKKWILVFITGIVLTLTHPVILFYSACIVLCMGVFAIVMKKTGWREIFQLTVIVVIVMLPYLMIRVIDHSSVFATPYDAVSARESFEIERYTRVANDIFYGLNPDALKFVNFEIGDSKINTVLQIFRLTPVFVALLAGVIALINLRKGPLYWYILSCVLLIGFATIPYTGWILGYFVSARLISRAAWFSPMGLGGALLLVVIRNWLKSSNILARMKPCLLSRSLSGTGLGLIACTVFISPVLVYHFLPRIPAYFEVLDHNKQLSQVGAYIDQNTTGPVTAIALDYWDTQLLPGVSAHTMLISFREETEYNGFNYFLSIDEIRQRIYASNVIRSLENNVLDDERCGYIKKFGVRFVVAQNDTVETFKSKLRKCNFVIEDISRTKNLILLELK